MAAIKRPLVGAWEHHYIERQIAAINDTLEELIVSTGDMQSAEQQVATDVTQLEQDHAAFRSAVAAQIADVQAEVDKIKGNVGDPTVLQGLDQRLQALHNTVQGETTTVSTSDPGAQTAPVVTAITPTAGSSAGGTQVTITGSGFSHASAVNFGSTAAESFTIDSDLQITATTPAGTDGQAVDVTVVNPVGTSATGVADQFSYTG